MKQTYDALSIEQKRKVKLSTGMHVFAFIFPLYFLIGKKAWNELLIWFGPLLALIFISKAIEQNSPDGASVIGTIILLYSLVLRVYITYNASKIAYNNSGAKSDEQYITHKVEEAKDHSSFMKKIGTGFAVFIILVVIILIIAVSTGK